MRHIHIFICVWLVPAERADVHYYQPGWTLDGTKPTRAAWLMKEQILPPIYWKAMLRGREWLAKPETVAAKPPAAA